ncbi:hypothetical protein [Janthinobacterium sp. UMAB-56]|uniref:hypothetical protein n=1 Tax=Janthinobacterium sp. UMAB-56 TaxID=1365361 RepID=UPI001C58E667|nr:hypothetical protein [Janthinobacterium sp. UMAB-56]
MPHRLSRRIDIQAEKAAVRRMQRVMAAYFVYSTTTASPLHDNTDFSGYFVQTK